MKPIAIQLYTLREKAQKDFAGVLKSVADMGYAGVEPAGLYGLTPQDVRKRVADLGMVVSSFHGPFPTPENLNEVLDQAKGLGTDTVVSGFGPDAFKTAELIKAAADKVNLVTSKLAAAGVQLALHNHYWEFDKVNGRLGYDLLMEQCPGVKSELDVYWAANFGACDPAKEVAKNKARTVLLHLKDGPLVKDQPMTAVGKGKVNIPAVIAAADPKVLRWLIVELDACATDMTQAVADSYRYLVGQGLASGRKPA